MSFKNTRFIHCRFFAAKLVWEKSVESFKLPVMLDIEEKELLPVKIGKNHNLDP